MHEFVETATAEKVVTSTGTGKGPTQQLALQAAIKAANDALSLPTEQSGYANIVSNTHAPLKSNTNEFFKYDVVDTDSWKISADKYTLECVEAGVWQFTAQYQLVALSDGLTQLHGWININDVDVEYSDAYGSSTLAGNGSVLTIAFAYNFKVGDKLKWGINSGDVEKLVCKNGTSPTGVVCPSLILTAVKSK